MRRFTILFTMGFVIGVSVSAQQYARPDGDEYVQDWLPTPLYEQINEESPSESDSIASELPASVDTCEVSLSDVSDPGVTNYHIVRHRFQSRESGSGQPADLDYDVRLMEGSTERAVWHYDIDPPTGWETKACTLSSDQANSLTDYTDLRLQFIANQAAGARDGAIDVSWAELEVPSVPTGRRRIIIAE